MNGIVWLNNFFNHKSYELIVPEFCAPDKDRTLSPDHCIILQKKCYNIQPS